MNKTVIEKDIEANVWILRIETTTGKTQQYRCASENQAKQLATVLVPNEKQVA